MDESNKLKKELADIPGGPTGHIRQMTISDLITMCNEAIPKMSNKNPHKVLIWNCATALRQLSDRLYTAENPSGPKGRIN